MISTRWVKNTIIGKRKLSHAHKSLLSNKKSRKKCYSHCKTKLQNLRRKFESKERRPNKHKLNHRISDVSRSVLELREIGRWVDRLARDAVLVLVIVRDRIGNGLRRWLAVLDKLVPVNLLLDNLLVVIALHKVRDAASAPRVQHLLTRLRVLGHHLVMLLLLLLQLIVERLELAVLVGCSSAENRIYVLSEWDFGTEAIHLVIIRASLHSYRW